MDLHPGHLPPIQGFCGSMLYNMQNIIPTIKHFKNMASDIGSLGRLSETETSGLPVSEGTGDVYRRTEYCLVHRGKTRINMLCCPHRNY